VPFPSQQYPNFGGEFRGMIRNKNIPKMHCGQVFWGKLAKNGKSPERPIKPLTHSFTPRGLGVRVSHRPNIIESGFRKKTAFVFGAIENIVPTISQLLPENIGSKRRL
jgi:hypothetical protein